MAMEGCRLAFSNRHESSVVHLLRFDRLHVSRHRLASASTRGARTRSAAAPMGGTAQPFRRRHVSFVLDLYCDVPYRLRDGLVFRFAGNEPFR